KRGAEPDWDGYYEFCGRWLGHSSWAVMPDVIEGDEYFNDRLIAQWPFGEKGAPVCHMHERIARLERLCDLWPRVCIGSSADYAILRTPRWYRRMDEAMDVICDEDGTPPVALHMLRGMALVEDRFPFASVDSTDVAQNHNRNQNTARSLAERCDGKQCPARWRRVGQQLEHKARTPTNGGRSFGDPGTT